MDSQLLAQIYLVWWVICIIWEYRQSNYFSSTAERVIHSILFGFIISVTVIAMIGLILDLVMKAFGG